VSGRLVVLEGGEGSGKSTQAALLARRLREHGREVVETFEPGATALGARVRELLLHGAALEPRAELLLLAADRAQHVAEIVRPALARGADVVSDRYAPSTLAYQGRARGLGVDVVASISRFAADGLEPDVVVVLDVARDEARARRPRASDRFERAPDDFHDAVVAAYRELSIAHGWAVVDGSGPPGEVAARVWDTCAALLD
jgi:dTMP kinase